MAKYKSCVLHDETVNTKGFRMLTSGANLEEFRKNPVMLLNHNDWQMPIGRWENIRIAGTQILADPVFDLNDPTGRQVADKWDNDFIRSASIGAWPPESISDDPMMMLNGQTLPTVTKWTVREASIVTIGSNHNALGVALYDRETGNVVEDPTKFIKLFDINITNQKPKTMSVLTKILNLSDGASEDQIANSVRQIIANGDRLRTENQTLTQRIDEITTAEKQKLKEEAVALVDGAIKDGRINAEAKSNMLNLFDKDHEAAKATLAAIPKRTNVTDKIGDEGSNVELADLQKQTWDQLDKGNKLTMLKDKYPTVYEEKFEQRFGCKPKK